MEMGDQYGLPELRRFLSRRTHFPATPPQVSEPYFAYSNHRNMAVPYHDAFMVSNGMAMPSGLVRFGHDHFAAASASTSSASPAADTAAIVASASSAAVLGVEMESCGWSLRNIDGGNSRWPRQETLTLLEIRSRLDSKFKEANQKGPLWDEVSRIMAEEHGYQRSGKKCREKFENLYKYYKKTKEGKAGRQDGKNYRFFRQLEALYGETRNQSSLSHVQTTSTTTHPLCQTPNHNNTTFMNNQENNINIIIQESLQEVEKVSDQSLSFSNASELETSSSENNDDDLSAIAFMMEKQNKRKAKVKELVESEMKKLINSQDVWMERMLKTIEDKEQERKSKEEEWRREEAARLDKEHQFWARERAWVEARDAALMEALNKFTTPATEMCSHNENRWTEHEISSLIQTRTSSYADFRSSSNSPSNSYAAARHHHHHHHPQQQQLQYFHNIAVNQGDEDQPLWDRYGLKLSKGKNH